MRNIEEKVSIEVVVHDLICDSNNFMWALGWCLRQGNREIAKKKKKEKIVILHFFKTFGYGSASFPYHFLVKFELYLPLLQPSFTLFFLFLMQTSHS